MTLTDHLTAERAPTPGTKVTNCARDPLGSLDIAFSGSRDEMEAARAVACRDPALGAASLVTKVKAEGLSALLPGTGCE